jgi:hypothetical protein
MFSLLTRVDLCLGYCSLSMMSGLFAGLGHLFQFLCGIEGAIDGGLDENR